MTEERLTRQDLESLTKSQLISFILQKIVPCEDKEAKVCIQAPPVDMKDLKLPLKPPSGLNVAFGPTDYQPLNPPPIPPPIPTGTYESQKAKKKNVLPESKVSGTHRIFVKCERCDKTFIIDLPKAIVLSNPLEVVPVTIMHDKNHTLTVYLDQNFESRRDYVSELFYIEND